MVLRDGRTVVTQVIGADVPDGDARGGDLVLFEAGLGAGGGCWGLVTRILAEQGISCVSYDRAGYGRSTPVPGPRRLQDLADDLEELIGLLDTSRRPERIVLVAHSWGGPVARIVADRRRRGGRPLDGLVLVDPSDEKAKYFFSPALRALDRAQALLAPLGSRLRMFGPAARLTFRALPEPERSFAVAGLAGSAVGRTIADEIAPILPGLWDLLRHPVDVGPAPLVIVSAQRSAPLEGRARRDLLAAHALTAEEAADGRVVRAEESGHLVMLSEPELIAEQVMDLLPGRA